MRDLLVLLFVHVVIKTVGMEIFTLPFGKPRQRIVRKSVPHVQHDYLSSFNQSNHWFVALILPFSSSFLLNSPLAP